MSILTHPVTPIVLIVVAGAAIIGVAISVRSAHRKAQKEAARRKRLHDESVYWAKVAEQQAARFGRTRPTRGVRGVRSTRPASSAPAPRQSDYNAYDPTAAIVASSFIASDPTPSRDCDTGSSSSHYDSGSSSSSSDSGSSSSSSSDSGGSFSSGDSGSF